MRVNRHDKQGAVEALLSVGEARDVLGISDPTIWRLVRGGLLPTVNIGRRRLVHPDDLRAFINQRRATAEGESRA